MVLLPPGRTRFLHKGSQSTKGLLCKYSVVGRAAYVAIQNDVNLYNKTCILNADLLNDAMIRRFSATVKTVPFVHCEIY